MADLQGKENKTASIIPAPVAPETIETPTPEVAEFSGDTRDTNRKRGKPTSAAERRKAVREARAAEKAQEAQDAGDLGTPVNSIELFPGNDSSQQDTQQSSPQIKNNAEAKKAEIKRIDKAIEKAKENKKKESDVILNSTRNKLKENGINDPAGALVDISNKYEAELIKLQEEKDSLLGLNKVESPKESKEAKIADIERITTDSELQSEIDKINERRQEALDDSVLSDGEIKLLKQGASENEIANYQSDNHMRRDGKGAIKEFNEINAKYDAEIDDAKKAALRKESPSSTNASKSNRSTQVIHIPLTPITQGLDNSKAIDNSIAEENKATANKETA